MSGRVRVAVGVVVGLALLGGLVAVGRWEARRHAHDENARIARIRALVGPLDRPKPDAFRVNVGTGFDCLLWKRRGFPYALELCFTADGRVVEAIDRRAGGPHIASLREDPGRATTQIDPSLARRLLRGLGAPVA